MRHHADDACCVSFTIEGQSEAQRGEPMVKVTQPARQSPDS